MNSGLAMFDDDHADAANFHLRTHQPSVSIIIPARNERGNILPIIKRIPKLCDDMEIIFVEGNSDDGTWDVMELAAYINLNVKAIKQGGHGKADAVFAGFNEARNDILMILDADMTVPPEELTLIYNAIRGNPQLFVTGTRMILPMERGAMQFLNYYGNMAFAKIASLIIGQKMTDTLCGSKAIYRSEYYRTLPVFSELDPWGDWELIFGAVEIGLKIKEIPINYKARTYGKTKIQRFRDGLRLLRMVWHVLPRRKVYKSMAQKAIA